jgi:hypothetical protein
VGIVRHRAPATCADYANKKFVCHRTVTVGRNLRCAREELPDRMLGENGSRKVGTSTLQVSAGYSPVLDRRGTESCEAKCPQCQFAVLWWVGSVRFGLVVF